MGSTLGRREKGRGDSWGKNPPPGKRGPGPCRKLPVDGTGTVNPRVPSRGPAIRAPGLNSQKICDKMGQEVV